MAAAVSPPSVCAASSLVILLCQPVVPPHDDPAAFTAASEALRAAAERLGATLSVNGRPAVPANSLTHICCSSAAQLRESNPSLWRRHVHTAEKVRGTTTRLVTPEWLWRTVDEEVGPSAAGYDMLASDSQWLSSRTLQQWHASQWSSQTPQQPQSQRAAKRARVNIQEQDLRPQQFDGRTILHNLLPGERASPAHVSIRDLTPEGCICALATTMYPDGGNRTGAVDWLRDNCPVKDMLIITNGCGAHGGALKVTEMFDEERPRKGGWIVRHVRPKGCSGLLHAGLLLFRTESLLRVVIFGGNLNKQPELDRDGVWCQDFQVMVPGQGSNLEQRQQRQHAEHRRGQSAAAATAAADSAGRFGARLRQFVDYINPPCRPEQEKQTPSRLWGRIQGLVQQIFEQVDFSTANVSLVASMPGQRWDPVVGGWVGMAEERGGWRRLREAVTEQGGQRMTMSDPFYVSSGKERLPACLPACLAAAVCKAVVWCY